MPLHIRPNFFLPCKLFAIWLLTFIVGKMAFFVHNGFPPLTDTLQIIGHGLPLDIAVAAYTTAPAWLCVFIGLWSDTERIRKIGRRCYRVYTATIGTLILITLIVDTILYEKWGFKLDAVCLSYLDNPSGITDSLGIGYFLLALAGFCLLAWAYIRLLWHIGPHKKTSKQHRRQSEQRLHLIPATLIWLTLGGLLFLGIRGGIGRSTANVGMVYYSTNQYYNHAAVNPVFSFFYSLLKERDFSKQAQYYSPEEAQQIFANLHYNTQSRISPSDSLLNRQRPNILLILMESCGGRVVGCTEGNTNVTPHIDALAREGVFFSQCYANSFRTDRGTICTFSGYPSFPDASVMKMPAKSRVLPSIAGALRQEGYDTEFWYGGDKNFTNMNSYFLATGYNRVFGDVDFPTHLRTTGSWGIADHLMLARLLENIRKQPRQQPWFKTLLTLSSHEPWEVPYQRLDDKILNSFAYLDQSIGNFIAAFRKTPEWKNTLIIILPDHGVSWPANINEFDTRKYHIPLIWAGGAVKQPKRIDKLCNQTDLVATLLGQMQIPHSRFRFSRDILSQTYTYPCAIHTWPEGYTFIDSTGTTIYELATRKASRLTPDPKGERLKKIKAFMQTAYRDLDSLK